MKKETWIVIGIAVAIILGNWLLLGDRREDSDDAVSGYVQVADTDTSVPVDLDISVSDPALTGSGGVDTLVLDAPGLSLASTMRVRDQAPGSTVEIEELDLKTIAWVVVYEDRNGSPWNILGASRLRPENKTGSVDLLRSMIDGNVYYVVLHHDDGDDTFDYQKDVQIKDATGNLVMSRFVARVAE
jgi:hypothetical protein